jgi:Fis family transcriptional regulator, factor for inversion stimulation protein
MAPKKKTKARKEPLRESSIKVNGHTVPLRTMTAEALNAYFTSLNGHKPGHLYDLVLREVEEPLFRAALGYAQGNQSRAAELLGINRGTLRKKLRTYGLSN